MGGYLKRIGPVKSSHSWLVREAPPRNPDEEKKLIHQQSVFCDLAFFSSSRWWRRSPFSFVSSLLGRCLSDYLDAVLLELGSKQRVFILKLFDLQKNKS